MSSRFSSGKSEWTAFPSGSWIDASAGSRWGSFFHALSSGSTANSANTPLRWTPSTWTFSQMCIFPVRHW